MRCNERLRLKFYRDDTLLEPTARSVEKLDCKRLSENFNKNQSILNWSYQFLDRMWCIVFLSDNYYYNWSVIIGIGLFDLIIGHTNIDYSCSS